MIRTPPPHAHVPRRARVARRLRAPALGVLAGALVALAFAGCGSLAVVGAHDGSGNGQGGDGGVADGGVADGGAAGDGGVILDGGTHDGGTLGDGGDTDGGGSTLRCRTDADCPTGQLCQSHCPVCDTDAGPCPGTPCYLACTPQPNCGDLTCTPDQVCVIGEGGAVLGDGGANVTYTCESYPAQCQTVAACDCVGRAICGVASQTDCSGTIPVVTCQYP